MANFCRRILYDKWADSVGGLYDTLLTQYTGELKASEAFWGQMIQAMQHDIDRATASFESWMDILRAMNIPYDPRGHITPMPIPMVNADEAREAVRRWWKMVRVRRLGESFIQVFESKARRRRVELQTNIHNLKSAFVLHCNFISMAYRYAWRWRKVGKPVQLAVRWKQRVCGRAPNLSKIGSVSQLLQPQSSTNYSYTCYSCRPPY